MRSPAPSADIRSNRCVPLRGTSAGYASASSASIRLLKSGAAFAAGPVLLGLEQTIPPVIMNNNTGGHIILIGRKKTRTGRAFKFKFYELRVF